MYFFPFILPCIPSNFTSVTFCFCVPQSFFLCGLCFTSLFISLSCHRTHLSVVLSTNVLIQLGFFSRLLYPPLPPVSLQLSPSLPKTQPHSYRPANTQLGKMLINHVCREWALLHIPAVTHNSHYFPQGAFQEL